MAMVAATAATFGLSTPSADEGGLRPPHPVPVILDTDMLGDVDDVGAVAVLHALADAGEATILGMGVSTPDPWSGRCLAALNTYFGRAELPLGLLRGRGFAGKKSRYTRQIAEGFPGGTPLDGTAGPAAPDAWRLYRKLLAAAPDASVVVVSVGYLDNLALLLESGPDEASPLAGRDLVARKVRAWVCMGGRFPEGEEACNFRRSPEAAARVLADWPTLAIFIGGELGDPVLTGPGLKALPAESPVRRAWDLFNGIGNRASWDQLAVLHAVRGMDGGLDEFWSLREGGTVTFDPATAAVAWREAPGGRHGYLVARMPPAEIAADVEQLMLHQPARAEIPVGATPRAEAAAAPAGPEAQPLPFIAGSETLVVLPDTEGYAGRRPETFAAMLRWVADERERRAIRGLLHVGDVTNRNTPQEWANARKAFDLIEGTVPYVLAAGNHDYDGQEGRKTLMNNVFKVETLSKWPSFGGVFEEGRLENHWQSLEIHGKPWIVISMEMGPRRDVIAWADKVLTEHSDRLAIILTHAYLFRDNERYDHRKGDQRSSPHGFRGDGADGQELWESLLSRHANVMLVVCGHVASACVGYRADEGVHGNMVHQMLVDYEKLRDGGMGFLRLLEFLPDGKTVQVRTFSPITKGTNPVDPALEEFRFELRPSGRMVEAAQKPGKPFSPFPTRALADLPHVPVDPPPNRYGGLADTPHRSTGFFRTEQVDGRWWLVDPEGGRFISRGVNSVAPLPTEAGRAALRKMFGDERAWADETVALLRAAGFNTAGAWSDGDLLRIGPERLATTQLVGFMSGYGKRRGGTVMKPGHVGYPNDCPFIFEPGFTEYCEERARSLAATRDDPWLIGYYSDNELPWSRSLLENHLALPADTPGHRAARDWLAVNGTDPTDVDDKTREAFLEFAMDRYFATVAGALRRHDPNHLFLGARFHGGVLRLPEAFRAAGRHCDVVSVNYYRAWTPDRDTMSMWARQSGKPFLVTEFYAKGVDSGLANTGGAGWLVKTQRDRGLFYQNFVIGLLASPDCVGWHWHRYADNDPPNGKADQSNRDSNKGIVSAGYEPWSPVVEAATAINRRIGGLLPQAIHPPRQATAPDHP